MEDELKATIKICQSMHMVLLPQDQILPLEEGRTDGVRRV